MDCGSNARLIFRAMGCYFCLLVFFGATGFPLVLLVLLGVMGYIFPKPVYVMPLGGERDSLSKSTKRLYGPGPYSGGFPLLGTPKHSMSLGGG